MGAEPKVIAAPTKENIAADQARTLANLDELEQLIADGEFDQDPDARTYGLEIELICVDPDGQLMPVGQEVIDDAEPFLAVTHEVNRANIELNVGEESVAGNGFAVGHANVRSHLRALARIARVHHRAGIGMFGIAPTTKLADLTPASVTPSRRYTALNAGVMDANNGEIHLHIEGESEDDTLDVVSPYATPIEGGLTSTQIHLSMSADEFPDGYNAGQLAAGPLLVASAGTPYFDGRWLGAECRIMLFEQAIPDRTFFGDAWITGVLSYFRSIVERYGPVILEEPNDDFLRPLRMRTGTVWNWTRGCIFPGTLTKEGRGRPSGPTAIDIMADAVFDVGLTLHLMPLMQAGLSKWLPFGVAKDNFYAAARSSQAILRWPVPNHRDSCETTGGRYLVQSLLEPAAVALENNGADRDIVDRFLSVVDQRMRTHTASDWLRGAIGTVGPEKATQLYLANAQSGLGPAVGEWEPVG